MNKELDEKEEDKNSEIKKSEPLEDEATDKKSNTQGSDNGRISIGFTLDATAKSNEGVTPQIIEANKKFNNTNQVEKESKSDIRIVPIISQHFETDQNNKKKTEEAELSSHILKAEEIKKDEIKPPDTSCNNIKSVNKQTELMEEYEVVSIAKGRKKILSDILDPYKDAVITKDTIHNGKEIYKVLCNSETYIFKVATLDISEKADLERLTKIKEGYKTMEKLGLEHPYFIKAINLKEVSLKGLIRIEILMEYGGKDLYTLMKDATIEEIKRWMIQSIDAFMYSEERRISHFDIKPKNMVYKNGILKVIDLEASVEFGLKDDVFNKLKESGKRIHEFTKLYAPIEMLQINQDDIVAEKFDIYCWGISFYQIITNSQNKDIVSLRKKHTFATEEEYKKFLNKVRNNEKLLKIDEKHIISEIIVKCLSFKPEERPSFNYIEHAIREIGDELISNDLQIAEANFSIGFAYRRYISNFTNSLHYHEKALKVRIKLLGEIHIETARSYNNIAHVYCDQDNNEKGLELYEKALSIRLNLLGENHTDTAWSYNNIAACYEVMGDLRKSLQYYEKSVRILLKLFGEENIDTATLYNNIGIIYCDLGNKEKALEFSEKAYKINYKLLGDEIRTATNYNNFAYVNNNFGNGTTALEFSEKSLKINLNFYGEEHAKTAWSYYNIANAYNNIGKMQNALDNAKRALNIRLKLFGKMNIFTADSYFSIGNIYRGFDDKKQALDNYEKSMDIRIKILGKNHPKTKLTGQKIEEIKISK